MTVSKQFYTFVDTLDGAVYHRFFDEDGVDKMEKIEEYDYTLYVEHPSDFSGQLSLTGKRLKEIRFKTVQEMGKFYFENKDRMEIHGNNSAAIQFIAKEYNYDVKQTCPINILNFDLEMEHGAGLIVYPDDYQVKCQDTNGNVFYTSKGEIKNRNLIVFDDRYKRWEEFKDSCFYPIGFPKPDQARGEIISASLKKFGDNEVMYSLGTKPLTEYDNPKGKYIQCKDEKELLVQFLKLWREINPHIICGWNIKVFDVPYLINRLKKVLGEKALAYLSPFKDKVKNNKKLIITKNNALMTTYEIFGITIYDYLEVYQKYNLTKQESYKLDHIGQVEIGQNKVRFDEYNKSLMNLYEGVINTDLTTPFKELDTIMKYARIREVTRRTLKKVGYESDRHLGDELFKFDAETFDFTVIKDADNDTLKGMYNYADERVKTLSYKKFISYNEQDANIVEEIDKKRRYIQMALRIAHMTKSKPKEIFGTVAPWDNMLYARLLERNVQIPPRQENSKKEKYPGAYVKKPVLGPHKWVTTVDAGSLYPNTIIACNMSPEMMVKTQDINYFETLEKLFNRELDTSDIVKRGHVIAANGAVFKQEQVGVIPDAMEYLITERKVVKNRMKDQNRLLQKELSVLDDLKQGKEVEGRTYEEVFKLCLELEDEVSTLHATEQALKILANSGYGALGEASFRYFRVDIATAITLTGRLFVISHVSKVVNDHLNKVCGTTDVEYCIYGDTDSVFIKLDAWVKMHKFDETNIDFVVTQIDEYMQNVIEPLIEESYIDLMAYIGAKRNDRMVMKREVISDSCIFRGKKNYMMQVWDNEGVRYSAAYYKRMGIETAKTSTAQIIRDKLEECLNIVINFEHEEPSKLKAIVDDFRDEFNKVEILSIAKPSGVNDIEKWLDDKGNIISGCPIHVRGAIVYNQFINSTPELKNAYEEIKDGDKIKFVNLKLPNILHSHVVAFIDDIPPEMEILESIDRKTQFEKTFMKPLESFTELINWDVRREFNVTSLFDDSDWDSTVVEEKEKVKKREVIVTSTIDDLFG